MIHKIYGPPGTGKTRRLLDIFQQELRTVPPERIAFLTFTKAARLEALSRAGLPEDKLPWLKTIHATCYKFLELGKSRVVTPSVLHQFGEQHNLKLSGKQFDPWVEEVYGKVWSKPTDGDHMIRMEHLRRHKRLSMRDAYNSMPVNLGSDISWMMYKWFSEMYRMWKEREGLLDYTDFLEHYLAHGEPLPVDVMFIDEAQDLSYLQWLVVERMGQRVQRLYVAGDDDQAIFTWAGASPGYLNQLQADKTEFLEQSHRLTTAVRNLAMQVITRVKNRQAKRILPRPNAQGSVVPAGYLTREMLTRDTFILFRNYQAGVRLGLELVKLGVPYTGFASPLDSHTVREALTGWKALFADGMVTKAQFAALIDSVAVNWVRPKAAEGYHKLFGVDDRSYIKLTDFLRQEPKFDDWYRVLSTMPYKDYVIAASRLYGFSELLLPRVQLLSIHQSKGREVDTVVLDLEMTQRTYDEYVRDDEDEHRVYYVGITRARERVYYLLPQKGRAYQL